MRKIIMIPVFIIILLSSITFALTVGDVLTQDQLNAQTITNNSIKYHRVLNENNKTKYTCDDNKTYCYFEIVLDKTLIKNGSVYPIATGTIKPKFRTDKYIIIKNKYNTTYAKQILDRNTDRRERYVINRELNKIRSWQNNHQEFKEIINEVTE